MKKLCVVFGLILLSATLVYAQSPSKDQPAQPAATASQPAPSKIDPAKEADIRRVLDVTGVKAMALQTIDSTAENIRPLMTKALPPGEYRDKLVDVFFRKFKARMDLEDLISLVVPVYDKYFTHEEIKEMLRFYETPLGQKTLRVLPQLMEEMRKQGESWGEKLGSEAMQEALSENPDLAEALDKAAKENKH